MPSALRVTKKTGRMTVSVNLDAMVALPPADRQQAFADVGIELQNLGWLLTQATGPRGRLRTGVLAALVDERNVTPKSALRSGRKG